MQGRWNIAIESPVRRTGRDVFYSDATISHLDRENRVLYFEYGGRDMIVQYSDVDTLTLTQTVKPAN